MVVFFKKCRRCIYRHCICFGMASENETGPCIYVPFDNELNEPVYVQSTAKALKELAMPRRQIPDWAASVIAAYDAIGVARFKDGRLFDLASLPDFGEAFGDDPAMTSVRDMMGFAIELPCRIRKQTKDRVRIVTTALLIARPDLTLKYDL